MGDPLPSESGRSAAYDMSTQVIVERDELEWTEALVNRGRIAESRVDLVYECLGHQVARRWRHSRWTSQTMRMSKAVRAARLMVGW